MKNATAISPSNLEPDKNCDPKSDQFAVLSSPKMIFETGTQIPEDTFTIQSIYDVYHIRVPTNAYFGPTDLHIQEYIPPVSFLNAEPNSAIIKAKGIKNKIPAITNQGIAA